MYFVWIAIKHHKRDPKHYSSTLRLHYKVCNVLRARYHIDPNHFLVHCLFNVIVPSWQYHCQGWLSPLMGVVLWRRHNEGLDSPKCPKVTVFIAHTIITSCWIESRDPNSREYVQSATFARLWGGLKRKGLHSKYISDEFAIWAFIGLTEGLLMMAATASQCLWVNDRTQFFLWIYQFIKKFNSCILKIKVLYLKHIQNVFIFKIKVLYWHIWFYEKVNY